MLILLKIRLGLAHLALHVLPMVALVFRVFKSLLLLHGRFELLEVAHRVVFCPFYPRFGFLGPGLEEVDGLPVFLYHIYY